MDGVRDGRRGFALAVVLLCLVALTALAHGAFALARGQERASRAATGALLARLAAEGAIRRAASGWGRESRRALRVQGEVTLPELRLDSIVAARTMVRALGEEWLWVHAVGTADLPGLRATRGVGSIHWNLDPETRIRALTAVVEHGGEATVARGAVVRGFASGVEEDGDAALCEEAAARMDDLVAPEGPAALGRSDHLAADARAGEENAGGFDVIPRLGLLKGRELRDRSRVAPIDSLPALTVIEGDHVVDGGTYDGLLAVGGDLVLTGEAVLRGLALVGGSLRVEEGAALMGGARVRQDVFVHESGHVEGSLCSLYAALESLGALARPLPAPEGGWIALH